MGHGASDRLGDAAGGGLETAPPCGAGDGEVVGAAGAGLADFWGAGEVAGDAAAARVAGGAAAPDAALGCAGDTAGAGAPPGGGLSCSFGARAPMFAIS